MHKNNDVFNYLLSYLEEFDGHHLTLIPETNSSAGLDSNLYTFHETEDIGHRTTFICVFLNVVMQHISTPHEFCACERTTQLLIVVRI